MTATTAARRPAFGPVRPGLDSFALSLVLFCVIPLVVALAVGGWVRLLASILAVGAAAGVVADGLIGPGTVPAPYQPQDGDCEADLQRAS